MADVHDLYSMSSVPSMAPPMEIRRPVENSWPGFEAKVALSVCEAAVMIVVAVAVAVAVVLTVIPTVIPTVLLTVVLTVVLTVLLTVLLTVVFTVVTLSTALQRAMPTSRTSWPVKWSPSLLLMLNPIGGPHPRLVWRRSKVRTVVY